MAAGSRKMSRWIRLAAKSDGLRPMRWMVRAAFGAMVVTCASAADAPNNAANSPAFAFGIAYDPAAGERLYLTRCATCHDHPTGRTPAKAVIANNTPAYIFGALNEGVMKANATGISWSEKLAIAMAVSQNKDGGAASTAEFETPACTRAPPPVTLNPNGWNGWGRNIENTRYQPDPGFSLEQLPRLKLKWAMAVSGTRSGEPVIEGERLFTNDTAGTVYALDAASGCAYWRYNTEGPTRSTLSLAPLPGTPMRVGAFLTDAAGFLYALDADHGTLLWRTKIDDQRSHQFTGSVTVYDGIVYAPVASGEEAYATDNDYPCCKFRGALVAVEAQTGKLLWTTYTTDQAAKPYKKNRLGHWMYGPSGAAIWSAPTIDAKRGLVYVATGDRYTDVTNDGADAVIAMDLKTGHVAWRNQLTHPGTYINGCYGPRILWVANCPPALGDDDDLGASPTLTTLEGGKEIILASQKSSQVYALDPDHQGKTLWDKRLSPGGPLGGSEWGHAVDADNVYVGISDLFMKTAAKPQLTALRMSDGGEVWSDPLAAQPCRWTNEYCAPGISMAVTAIPGAVFAGSLNGRLRAFSTIDGKVLWAVDAGATVITTTGAKVDGGTLDAAGPVVAGGRVYVHSGYWGRTGPGSVLLAFSIDGK